MATKSWALAAKAFIVVIFRGLAATIFCGKDSIALGAVVCGLTSSDNAAPENAGKSKASITENLFIGLGSYQVAILAPTAFIEMVTLFVSQAIYRYFSSLSMVIIREPNQIWVVQVYLIEVLPARR